MILFSICDTVSALGLDNAAAYAANIFSQVAPFVLGYYALVFTAAIGLSLLRLSKGTGGV